MKFSVDAKEFISLAESAMVKKGSSALIPKATMKVLKNSIAFVNATTRNDVASVIIAKSDHFTELENDEKKEIIIEQEMLDRLSEGFKSETTNFTTKDNNLIADDGTDHLEAELSIPEDGNEFPIPLTQTQYGLITDLNKRKADDPGDDWSEKDALQNLNVYKTTKDALSLPKRDSYEVSLKNGTLIATMPGTTTKMSHKIEGESKVGKKGSFIIDGEFYQNIVSNLSGEVHLIYNKSVIMFTNTTETLSKTYSAAARVETK